jgi:hypothetical protein
MKKVILAVALCVVAVLLLAAPAVAAPNPPLYTLTLTPDCGNHTGGGTVEFYPVNAPNSMKMKLELKGALPNTAYDLDCSMATTDHAYFTETTLGTVYTDNKGKGVLVSDVSGPYPSIANDYLFGLNLRLQTPGHLSQYYAGGSISFTNTTPLKLPLQLRCGNTSGGGKVALHASSVPDSVQMKLKLTGALPNQGYDVIWVSANSSETTVGTLYTDDIGNAKFVYTLSWASAGDHFFRIDLREHGGPNNGLLQYSTDGLIISVN